MFPKTVRKSYYLYNTVPAKIGQLQDKLVQIKKVVGKQKQEASTSAAKSGGEKWSAKKEPKNSKKQKNDETSWTIDKH